MTYRLIILSLLACCSAFADVNILLIGSSHSFSEGQEGKDVHGQAFNPKLIADELRKILSQDKTLGKVNVVSEDYYTNKNIDTAIGGAGNNWPLKYHRYSLAQYYFWPAGRADRLKNLQGKLKGKWDYIVLMDDPLFNG